MVESMRLAKQPGAGSSPASEPGCGLRGIIGQNILRALYIFIILGYNPSNDLC